MTLVWHDAHTLKADVFPAYEDALFTRARAGAAVLGFLRLTRCALLGAFEDPARALRLSYIGTRFPVIRRATGGGSLSLDPETLVLVLALPRALAPQGPLSEVMDTLCRPLIAALEGLGVTATFTAPNDIVSAGRKRASGFVARSAEVVVFEAVLPLELDVEELLKTLRLPLEKLSEKGLLAARERFAPLRDTLPALNPGRLCAALAQSLGAAVGLKPVREKPPRPAAVAPAPSPDPITADLSAVLKTPGGVVYLDLVLTDGECVACARVSGGIACGDPDLLTRLGGALKGAPVAAIAGIWETLVPEDGDTIGVARADFLALARLGIGRYRIGQRLGWDAARRITVFSPTRDRDIDALLAGVGAVLLPYCAKPTWCKWRHRDGCPECGQCAIGEAYHMARARDLRVVTITHYEHLRAVLAELKAEGVESFLGVCCTDFFLKRDYAFVEAGLGAVFLDIEGDTCYTLRAEDAAYVGRFEAQAFLDPRLLTQVLTWRDGLELRSPKQKR